MYSLLKLTIFLTCNYLSLYGNILVRSFYFMSQVGFELERSFGGKASNIVDSCGKSALKLVAVITQHFPGTNFYIFLCKHVIKGVKVKKSSLDVSLSCSSSPSIRLSRPLSLQRPPGIPVQTSSNICS